MQSLAHPCSTGITTPAPAGNQRRGLGRAAPLALALGLPALVYFPITRNFFRTDDFLHLYDIVNKDLGHFLVGMHGGHLLTTSNAIFALFYHAFGTNTAYYFSIVLVTHLLNVYLLYRIVHTLTDSTHLACFGSALWGTLPVHEGALGWYSVYGHVLVATFVFPVLLAMARIARGMPPHRLAPAAWVFLLLAASTSFGVGIGVTLAMPVAAFLLLPRSSARTRAVLVFSAVALATPCLYLGVHHLYVDLYGESPPSIFPLAVLRYWHPHLRMLRDLAGSGVTALMLGVFHSPRFYPGTIGYLLVAAYATVLLAAFWRASGRTRGEILACAAICAASYGIIAAGRGLLSMGNVTWITSAPRFHYVATGVLAIATCLALASLGTCLRGKPWLKTSLLLAWVGATLAGHFATGRPVQHFDTARRETEQVLAHVRRAARSATGSDIWIRNRPFKPVGPFYAGKPERFPGWAAVFTIYFPENSIGGTRVRFIEEDAFVIESARRGRRIATLLVSPEEAPGPVN